MRFQLLSRITAVSGAVILMLSAVNAAERSGRIRGRITDAASSAPIAGATVLAVSSKATVGSDANGLFQFDSLPLGVCVLRISHSGYYDVELKAEAVAAGREHLLAVVMRRKDASDKKAPETATDSPSLSLRVMPRVDGLFQPPTASIGKTTDKAGRVETGQNSGGNYKPDSYYRLPLAPDVYSQPYDMFFQDYGTNGFVDTRRDRFSTFGADVDDASYNLARRYLLEGNLPPQGAIRVEEFINHFDYGYRSPEDAQFRIFSELSASPFRDRTVLLKLGIKGRELAGRERRPLNLSLVIDCSGSMGYDTRLELVKQSVRMLVDQLNVRDRIGIIAYGSNASVILEPTPANRRGVIFGALERLYPHGSTYAEAGLRLGYQMADRMYAEGRSNLVILFSDGVANVGQTTPEAIMRSVKQFANRGIILSTFGVGMGNYNDVLLEKLARKGNGRYAYVNDIDEARKQFVEQLTGNVQVLGRDMKIQVEFNPQVVASYRLLGYEKRAVPDQKFRDNRQDGGEVGSGHEVTALYELVLTGRRGGDDIGTVAVRWINPGQTEVTEVQKDISIDESYRSFDSARPEFRLAFVAAKFAEFLKSTPYSDNLTIQDISHLAQSVVNDLDNEQTRELVDLVEHTADLTGYHSEWLD